MSHGFRRIAALPLLAFAVACGSTGPDVNDLSEAEAALVLSALSAVWFPAPSTPMSAPLLAPVTTVTNDTTDTVVACPAGGSATVLSIDSTTTTTDSRLNPSPDTLFAGNTVYAGESTTTVSYDNCQSADGQGTVWAFAAAPGLTFSYDFQGTLDSYSLTGESPVVNTVLNWSGLWSGSFTWTNGGRSGTCSISMSMTSATTNLTGQVTTSYSQEGQICGLDISASG